MTSTYHRQKNLQDRWILILISGFVALCISVVLLRVNRSRSFRGSSDHSGTWKLTFHPPWANDDGSSSEGSSSSSYTFKIMQIADIHLGENSWTDWGPEQDVKTYRVLDSVILAEQPDLIVLSGDQLTANNVDENATAYYRALGERLSYYGIPWALIFGNHDDAPLEKEGPNNTIITIPPKTSRQQLLAIDQEFPLSLTQSTSGIFGSSNYMLNLHFPSTWSSMKKDDNDDIAVQLFFLDSGGGSLVAQLEQSQIDWFQQMHRPDLAGAIVFQHIPTKQFEYHDDDNNICRGLHDNGVDSIVNDPGIIETLQQAANVHLLAVGHNHGNDYCCSTTTTEAEQQQQPSNLHLCFGRHSGYGGYGNWDRGARIYELQLVQEGTTSSSSSRLKWRSWVRMENETIIDHYVP